MLQPQVSTKGKWGAVLQLLGEKETESLYAHFASAISPLQVKLGPFLLFLMTDWGTGTHETSC